MSEDIFKERGRSFAVSKDALMFATDYPHSESWFPKSVDAAR